MDAQDRSSGWIGTVLLGRWKIESKIARGGVATVFRARARDGRLAAVKIMHPQYARNADVRARFLREGYTANKVGHPNVVRILEDGTAQEGSPFLLMELLEDGEPLEERRERLGGRLPLDEVARAADQLLDVLTAAHAQGIVHRDIKPENLFVLANGTLKVLDFGIAHIKEAALEHEPTATGLLLGTPEFMSPEQALGKRGLVDAQSDVYAVGATMFTLLSGEAVHVYGSLPLLLAAVATRQARSLGSVAFRGLPREMIGIVDRALVLDKARRWASAREMRDAMRSAFPWAAEKAWLVPSPPPRRDAGAPKPRETQRPPSEKIPRLFDHESEPTLTIATGERPALEVPKPPSGRSWAPTPADGARLPRVASTGGGLPPVRTPGSGVRVPPPLFAITPPSGARAPSVAPPPLSERPQRAQRPRPSGRPAPGASESSVSPPSSGDTIAMAPGSLPVPSDRTVIRPDVAGYATMLEDQGVPTARDADAWSQPFDRSDMEGPTVALMAPPTNGSQSPVTPRMPPVEPPPPPDDLPERTYRMVSPFTADAFTGDASAGPPAAPAPPAFAPPMVPAPTAGDRAATARFALVGIAVVAVLILVAGVWLFLR